VARAAFRLGFNPPQRACLRLWSFAKPIASKFLGNGWVERFRCREIRAATVRIASTPQARETAAVERARLSRITGQRRIVVNNRLLKAAKLQICKAAAIKCAGLIGREPQGLVAICKRVLKKAQYRAIPAAIVPGFRVAGSMTMRRL
jgi:hypothetical protein